MSYQAAFIYLAPGNDPEKQKAVIPGPSIDLTVVGVKSYTDDVAAAQKLVAAGVGAIELCGGFGFEGVAMVKEAVGNKAAIGVVHFDIHPGLGNKSGDVIFNKK